MKPSAARWPVTRALLDVWYAPYSYRAWMFLAYAVARAHARGIKPFDD